MNFDSSSKKHLKEVVFLNYECHISASWIDFSGLVVAHGGRLFRLFAASKDPSIPSIMFRLTMGMEQTVCRRLGGFSQQDMSVLCSLHIVFFHQGVQKKNIVSVCVCVCVCVCACSCVCILVFFLFPAHSLVWSSHLSLKLCDIDLVSQNKEVFPVHSVLLAGWLSYSSLSDMCPQQASTLGFQFILLFVIAR